ncbi:MAG: hypothetical protein U0997_09870 [Sulfurimicrobium sp.]|nr:hypothetical protein [Sulfurimicrobium sp.]
MATIGYGYTFERSNNVALWQAAGITLSAAELAILQQIDSASTSAQKTAIALSQFGKTLTTGEAKLLLQQTYPKYESPANELGMLSSWERVALVSITYNRGEAAVRSKMVEFYNAIQNGNRAEAWFQIRYNSQTPNPLFANGIAKRRYYESEIFGLTDNPGSVSGVDEAKQIYRMLQLHRAAILTYENTYSAQINQANADYGLSVVTQAAVDTLTQALTPAYETLFADLQSRYSTGMAGLSASDFNPLNVYLDPNRNPGQSVVILDNPNHSAFLNSAIDPVTGQEVSTRDILIGEGGNDYLMGGKGDDVLIGGKGMDTYYWRTGDGNDRIIDEDKQGVIVINDGVQDLYAAGAFTETAPGSKVWKSLDGKITLTHNSPWKLVTGDGSEILLGDDWQDGDFGIHLLEETTPVTPLTLTGDILPTDTNPGTDGIQAAGDAQGNPLGTAQPYEDILVGSEGNDRIQSGELDDNIGGRGGDDWIEGGNGSDYVNGEEGNDLIEGGAGADILAGDAGDDRIYGNAKIEITAAIASGNSDPGTGQKGDWLSGNEGDDALIAGADNDVLAGGAGKDLLIAGAGDDYILGDAGFTPQFIVENTQRYSIGNTNWFHTSATPFNWSFTDVNGTPVFEPVEGEYEPLGGGADAIYAGAGNDTVWAGEGDDIVMGEGGNDTLTGEAGSDSLLGGGGNDTLVGDNGVGILPESLHGDDFLEGSDGNDFIAAGTYSTTLADGIATNDSIWERAA